MSPSPSFARVISLREEVTMEVRVALAIHALLCIAYLIQRLSSLPVVAWSFESPLLQAQLDPTAPEFLALGVVTMGYLAVRVLMRAPARLLGSI